MIQMVKEINLLEINYDILIVEDDTDTNNLITNALTKEGYQCVQAFSGTECLLHIKDKAFRLVILDLMLPGKNGEELIRDIKQNSNTPVIILSAKDNIDSKLQLLRYGAEDYMTKPFDIRELIVRVMVQLRRVSSNMPTAKKSAYKDLILNADGYSLNVGDTTISLTRQEYRIMELLMSSPKQVFSKQVIYSYAWDDLYIGDDNTVNVHISNIRKKLSKISDKEYIDTIWGIGFKMAE